MASAVVTAIARYELEAAGLRGLEFAPVIKDHVVEADWRAWDRAKVPPELRALAPSGEPEEILEGPHSTKVAAAMQELWELVPTRFDNPPSDIDVFRVGAHIVVSTHGLAAFFQAADTWFETAPVELDPNAG